MRVYVAGPLFTPDERQRLVRVAEAVEAAGADAHLPFTPGDFDTDADRADVYRSCLDGVTGADALVAVLDGVDVDSGVAYEIGYARARGTPVLGIRTDYRTLGPEGPVNTMLAQGVSRLAAPGSPEEEAQAVADFVADPPAGRGPVLVRDKVPQMRRRGGSDVEAHQVTGDAYVAGLKRYLVDRAEDLLEADGAPAEKDLLSDVLEGVETLIEVRTFGGDELRKVKEKREEEFGGLDDGWVLDQPPSDPPTSDRRDQEDTP